MTTLLDTIHFEAYVSACASRAKVRVEWDKPGSVPRTNGKTMYLPAITSKADKDYLSRLRVYVKHETSHITYTNFDYWQAVKPKGFLMFVINLLEDNRIDYLNDAEYAGDRALSDFYYAEFAEKFSVPEGEEGDEKRNLAPLFAWDARHRPLIASSVLAHNSVFNTLDATGLLRYNKLCAGTYGDELDALRTSKDGDTHDLLALARRILNEVYETDSKQYEDGASEDGKGKGEGEQEEGDGEDAAAGPDTIISVEEYMKKEGGEHIVSRTGIHVKADHSTDKGSYQIPSINEYVVYSWPKNPPSSSWGMGCLDKEEVEQVINNGARQLSNSLRMKLQVRSKGRYEYGTKSGRLHAGSLHRLVSARGTEAESRVFRKHVTSDTLDTAVSLLVDCSGSMSGRKFDLACAAAVSVATALRPLHIPYNILGFTNAFGKDEPVIHVFSEWGAAVADDALIKRFSAASGMLLENTDGDGIAWAYNHLMPRKEKRKVLLVLSDGAPAGRGWAGNCATYTKQVISDIEKNKKAEIYGIGICDHNVQRYYTKHSVINTAAELPSALLSILDKAL